MAKPTHKIQLLTRKATLADLWDRLAAVFGSRVAFTLEEPLQLHMLHASELTYQDLAEVVGRLAGALTHLGVRRNDRVAVCTANRFEYALIIFAAIRAGAVAVPLHHGSKPAEVVSLVKRSRARFLVADPPAAARIRGVTTLLAGPEGDLDRACAVASARKPALLKPDDAAVILFTSGTTGIPKGATLTSRSLLAVTSLAALAPDVENQSGICGLPLAHVMGLCVLLLTAISGARMHWLTKFDASRVLNRIVESRPTFFVGVPAMYALLAEAGAERYDLSSIKLFASGADAMPPVLLSRFREMGCALSTPLGNRLLTAAFAEVYGMVELSGPAILKLTPPGPPGRSAGTLGSFGIPIPPYRARVVDEAGKPVKAGVVGELVMRGPGVTKGYDHDPEATRRATHDGWLFTGDLAKRSRLGLIAFVTRKKDVIKHGGFSVFPAEVEAQLLEHPAIAEAVVFGAPHPSKGAVPVAVVVLKPGARATERELLHWARETIAPFKAPRAIVLAKSAEIPRNDNTKVIKDRARERFLPLLERQLQSRP